MAERRILIQPVFSFISSQYGGATAQASIKTFDSGGEETVRGVDARIKSDLSAILASSAPGERIITRLGMSVYYTASLLPEENIAAINAKLKTRENGLPLVDLIAGLTVNSNPITEISYNTNYIRATITYTDETLLEHDENLVKGLRNSGANMEKLDLTNVDFSKTNFNGANFSGAILKGANFTNASLIGSLFNQVFNQNTGEYIVRTDLTGANFTGADLRFAMFTLAEIDDLSFNGANMRYASIDGSNAKRVDFRGADLGMADFRGTNLNDCKVDENTKTVGVIITPKNNSPELLSLVYRNEPQRNAPGDSLQLARERRLYAFADRRQAAEARRQEEQAAETRRRARRQAEEARRQAAEARRQATLLAKENKLVDAADEILKAEGYTGEISILPSPLDAEIEIQPTTVINPRVGSNVIYQDVVEILSPKIINEKKTLSEMAKYKWYRISELGNTSRATWTQVGVEADEEPAVQTLFKCIAVPAREEGEAVVYESQPVCMAVHELAKPIRDNLDNILKMFIDVVYGGKGEAGFQEKFELILKDITKRYGSTENFNLLDKFTEINAYKTYILLMRLLTMHNANEGAEAWTLVFDNPDMRKKLVKHTVFNGEEGIVYHPRFFDEDNAKYLFLIRSFIQTLPKQIQVVWAQNYIQEFIEGYGQAIDTFDREKRSSKGFIASCINGNLEKMLLAIRMAIVDFYPREIEEETDAEKKRILTNALKDRLLNKYFETLTGFDDVATIEGYTEYIKSLDDISDTVKAQYVELLGEQDVIAILQEKISALAGGGKIKKHRKKNHTLRRTLKGKKKYTHRKKKHTLIHTLRKKKHTLRQKKRAYKKTNRKI